jgi:hypothetical protein
MRYGGAANGAQIIWREGDKGGPAFCLKVTALGPERD